MDHSCMHNSGIEHLYNSAPKQTNAFKTPIICKDHKI